MDANTSTQFELVRELGSLLDAAGIEWWLFGGWAMDFHAGRVTRDHSDIEAFVWAQDAGRVRGVLVDAGFAAPAGTHPDEGQPFLKHGQVLGVFFLDRAGDGRVHITGRWRDWRWPSGSFDGSRRRIADIEAPAMSVAGLIEMKANFEEQPNGAPRRAKDIADLVFLNELLARDDER